MQPRTDAPGPSTAASPADAAQRAASAESAIRRVAELERQLAQERAQNAARARDIESGVAVLRRTLHELQAEMRRARDENARLHAQLEQSRSVVSAMAAADRDDSASATGLELALEASRSDLAAVREELARARTEIDVLRHAPAPAADTATSPPPVAHCDAAPTATTAPSQAATQTTSQSQVRDEDLLIEDSRSVEAPPPAAPEPHVDEHATHDAPQEPAPAPKPPETVATHRAAAAKNEAVHARPAEPEQDPRFPQIPGIVLEKLVSDSPAALVFDARESATRRPVQVRLLPGVLRLLDGKKLDSVLLARHTNLVSVLNFAVCRQGPYLVLDREEGEPAGDWVKRIGVLPERIALTVALETARGLRQAAFHGALHGDLEPSSILIDVAGRVRVRGVGLRAVLGAPEDRPAAPAWASPERLRGAPPPDARSDLYSLGAVMHHLLTGKPPFDGDREAILRSQTAGAVPDVRESRPDVSEDTAKLIRKLLSPDPDLRPQTWDQLLVELERRVPGRISTALRGNLLTRTKRFLAAHPWVLGASGAGILVLSYVWHALGSEDPTAAQRFRDACVVAEKLAASGDVDGARTVYRRFLSGTGDSGVEREAAARYDALK